MGSLAHRRIRFGSGIIKGRMADRPTSFAKSVEGLHHEESALDRARILRDQFEKAQEQKQERQIPREAERPREETGKSGSQMVKEDAPVLRPTPSGPMRQPDRQAAYGKLAKERSVENKKNDAAKMAQEFWERQQKSHDHDRDRGR
jgi:hypothetical protein